jgi:hypothetical protein
MTSCSRQYVPCGTSRTISCHYAQGRHGQPVLPLTRFPLCLCEKYMEDWRALTYTYTYRLRDGTLHLVTPVWGRASLYNNNIL